jgi:hypothetical protein
MLEYFFVFVDQIRLYLAGHVPFHLLNLVLLFKNLNVFPISFQIVSGLVNPNQYHLSRSEVTESISL